MANGLAAGTLNADTTFSSLHVEPGHLARPVVPLLEMGVSASPRGLSRQLRDR